MEQINDLDVAGRIRENDQNWYLLADEKLADAVFSSIKEEYKNAKMVKIGPPYQESD